MKHEFTTLYEIVAVQAKKRKGKVALLLDDEKITYGETLEKVDKLAVYLQTKGIKEGDCVALFLRNSPEFVYSLFAISKIGAIVVPINTFLKEEEVDYILEDSGAKFLIASDFHKKVVNATTACSKILWAGVPSKERTLSSERDFFEDAYSIERVSNPVKRVSSDCAVIIYTSGTTGNPKGAMLSHNNLLSNMEYAKLLIAVKPKDRVIVFLPMFHTFTLTVGVLMPLYAGGSMVIIKSLQPFSNIFKQTLTKRVTLFFGIPDIYNALAKAKLPWYFLWLNKIRAFISGAAALQPKTLDAMSKRFKRAKLLEGYGLSEASPVVCVNTVDWQKAGSVGRAMYGHQIKIVDEDMNEVPSGTVGDIIFKGENVMLGYLNRPEATYETIVNGWLLTGDMGYKDEDEFLFIVDRKKDLIISKGINIYPRGIEEVIDVFPGVAVSAVVGIEDERSGEIPVVYIELEDGVEKLDEVGLKKHMREHLANYKIPRHIHVIDALPKNATGKILKRGIKRAVKRGADLIKAIVNGRVVLSDKIVDGKVILFDSKIVSIVDSSEASLEDVEIIDAKGAYVSAGFIDMHIHGSGGADVMDASFESLNTISSTLLQTGTTSFLATTMTMSKEHIRKALLNVKENACRVSGANVLGLHMEGPFINPGKAGAQDKKEIQCANLALFEEYADEVKMITLAPEIDGAEEFMRELKSKFPHIIVSIGHSEASYEECKESFSWGVSHVTHLFNAMPALHHRKPGIVAAAYENEDVSCEIIADLIHVHPSMLNLTYKIKRKKLFLVTDSMRAGCMKCDTYDLGGQEVTVNDGKAILKDGTLAGSVLKMNDAVKNMYNYTDMTIVDAVNSVTKGPAEKLALRKGQLLEGYDADIVIFDEDFSIIQTIISGEIYYRRNK